MSGTRRLISLVEARLEIVKSKKGDVRSIQRKKDTWDNISSKYNSMPDITGKLNAMQLMKFWRNMKTRWVTDKN